MKGLILPDDMRDQVVELIESNDPAAEVVRKQQRLEDELRRVNRIYQSGNMADSEYDRESRRVRAELAAMAQPAEAVDVQSAIDLLRSMATLWGESTAEERAEMVREIFEAIRVDTGTRRITGIKPKNKYAALCQAAYSKNGRDGIRVFARRESGYRPKPSEFCESGSGIWHLRETPYRDIVLMSYTSLSYPLTELSLRKEVDVSLTLGCLDGTVSTYQDKHGNWCGLRDEYNRGQCLGSVPENIALFSKTATRLVPQTQYAGSVSCITPSKTAMR